MIIVNLHGVRLRLEASSSELITNIKGHLGSFATTQEQEGDYEIYVKLAWLDLPDKKIESIDKDANLERIDKRILVGENKVIWEMLLGLIGIKFVFELKGEQLYITAFYFYHRLLKGKEIPYGGLIYHLVYYPIFWHLEIFRKWHVLHSAAVSLDGDGIIISGMGGVGKSTLNMAILARPEARFLSDNLLLYDSERIYACPEPIQLRSNPGHFLGNIEEGLGVKIDGFDGFTSSQGGVSSYLIRREFIKEEAIPNILLFPRITNREVISAIPKEECLEKLSSVNQLVMEMRDYYNYSSVLNLLCLGRANSHHRLEALQGLLDGVNCYELGLKREANPQSILDQILI
jgi:hypothetical protein